MIIQINTDNNIMGREEITSRYQETLENSLERFKDQITRIEVHLSDENSHKKSNNTDDIRCLLEARLEGLQPLAVSHYAPNLDIAFKGALEKLKRSLDSTIGRIRAH